MSFKTIALSLTLLALPAVSIPALAQHTAQDHAAHIAGEGDQSILPTEGGQAGFAAIAEIVALLKADPETDWSKVSIDALREHLVDMNEVTLNASASQSVAGSEVIFEITGQGRTLRAVQAMVVAHSGVLTAANLYSVTAETIPTGAIMRVSFTTQDELQQIKALGFFGLMATGAHHQQHHIDMARGRTDMHQH